MDLDERIIIMSKKVIILGFFVIVLALAGCNFSDKNGTPEIETELTFSKLSDKDLMDIGTKDANIIDFRKVLFSVTVNNNTKITDREISLPNLKDIMNSYDKERYWYGEYVTRNNPNEDAEYRYDIMFLSKGLSEDDIKSVFTDSHIIVSWTNEEDKEEMRTINLPDIITFE